MQFFSTPRLTAVAGAALLALALPACAADPGPPPLVQQEELDRLDQSATTTTTPTEARPERTEIQVGAEPLRGGLNPHLLSDDSSVVQSIADLALPSAYLDGALNNDVVVGAAVRATSPAAMTVRYVINPEAQWSDGTPLTGADFAYLWRGMSTTAGAIDPAGYLAVSNVRVSGPAGKTVDVDFSTRVEDWQSLFNYLLPSHLLAADASDFATAARDGLPASGGRFMLQSVDRGRGTITLNRNDRFWGDNPARVDVLTINAVRDTTQIADQLRSGQLGFVDKIPEETTREVFELIPGTQTRLVDGPRTLGLTLSTTSPLLSSEDARKELRSLVDVPLLARLAAGRSSELVVADHELPTDEGPTVLPGRVSENRSLRIAADAADPEASAAARSLADLLVQRGVQARVVSTDTLSVVSAGLPSGSVDVFVHWEPAAANLNDAASRVACPPQDYRSGNLAGLCSPKTDELAGDILAGAYTLADARDKVDEVLTGQAVWVPLLHERRIIVLGSGIVGTDPEVMLREDGLSSAAGWRVGPTGAAPAQEPE
ncbi:ABC transporter family substrate-binding protein [Corynebacterium sanguinis]|nr:ABC transporter family substrate-binding protein [Corynebacterium sanguinis]MCT1584240.1 ABC transporter family substrate-binding protein [Corynebacterium sanguinis]MCT2022321.1 ABC transporter family substrate-binding protein [Corynebacterium sanguinis]MCT2153765.1 ABC transporter family substrate-binding protein [Corynebacterium sanguinis]